MNDFENKQNEETEIEWMNISNEQVRPELKETEEIPDEDNKKKKQQAPPFWLGILVGMTIALVIVLAAAVFTQANRIIRMRQQASATSQAEDGQSKIERKINTISSYIEALYLGEIDEEKMEEAIADGIIKGLGDKYAQYYTAKEFESLVESTQGQYAGIGVSVVWTDDNKTMVYKVYSGSPADEAGLHVGDYIIEAAGRSDFESLDDLVAVVRGAPETTVDIVLERDGEKIPVTVERRTIDMITVEHEMLEGTIGYIYIEEFDVITVKQFNEALDDLEKQGMKSLIIDLRDNPGGDYDTVVAMADRVLPEGPIMTVKDKNGTIKTENSDAEHYLDLPMVVIINEHSASASEVFAGAIDDYDMATIVGKTSYGKGIVQSILPLYDGSALKFTTQEYYTPSGDSIHGIGIKPDYEVDLPEEAYEDGILTMDEDTQLAKAIEILSK